MKEVGEHEKVRKNAAVPPPIYDKEEAPHSDNLLLDPLEKSVVTDLEKAAEQISENEAMAKIKSFKIEPEMEEKKL